MEERKEGYMGGFKGSEGQKKIIILKTSKMKEAIFKNKIRIFVYFIVFINLNILAIFSFNDNDRG